MKTCRGGGTHCKGASQIQQTHHHYNPQITSAEIYTGLLAVGFTHCERTEHLHSGKSIRIPAIGKWPSNRSASIKLSEDGSALFWHDWPSGERGTIFAERRQIFDSAEIARRLQADKECTKRHEAAQAEQHAKVAKQAQAIYRHGATVGTHPYIHGKQLSGLHNARLDVSTGALLIPMWVSGIGLVNLQRIFADGNKRFLKGGRKKGAYSVIGSLDGAERVLVATGWATSATLHELHSLPLVVAFDDGNLMPVCQSLRSRFENLTVIVAGDDDRQTKDNPGRTKAIAAAAAVGADTAFPTLCMCCTCTDHNDAAVCARRCARG